MLWFIPAYYPQLGPLKREVSMGQGPEQEKGASLGLLVANQSPLSSPHATDSYSEHSLPAAACKHGGGVMMPGISLPIYGLAYSCGSCGECQSPEPEAWRLDASDKGEAALTFYLNAPLPPPAPSSGIHHLPQNEGASPLYDTTLVYMCQ